MKTVGYVALGIVAIMAISIFFFATGLVGRMANHVNTAVDNAVVNYEEYQTIYNTCNKINLDLCNMKDLPDTDKMFEQFSKAQRINALRTQMNRWTEEYNAKSKMFNRSIWKSNSLPYQLQTNEFNCY